MTAADQKSADDRLPGQEEFFDAVRRHICQVLGFDYCFIDVVAGHEAINFTSFSATELDNDAADLVHSLEDEHQQPLSVAHTLLTQKVKQSQKPWIGHAVSKRDSSIKYPYLIVPVIPAAQGASSQVKGVIRVICLDVEREIDEKELSTLNLIGQHISDRLPQNPAAYKQPADTQTGAIEEITVLLVHSDRVARRQLSRIISSRYQVLEADSSTKALDVLQAKGADLIVLDSQGDGTSGFALCKMFKESSKWKHIPVILITADSHVGGKVEGLNAGADDCLSESCHETELLARIRASLRLRKTERELSIQWQLLEDYAQRLEQVFESERQASIKVSKHNQSLEQLNRELQQSKLKEQVLRGQEQLLHRISDIIRRSFNVRENISKTLEELAERYSLNCAFAVMPSEEEPQDSIRTEYATDDQYKVMEKDLDLSILETFRAHFSAQQAIVVNDVLRDRIVDPFRKTVLIGSEIKSLFYVPITYEEKLLGILGGHRVESEAQWSTENTNFFTNVAGQIATGVTNARLYARVQRQAITDGLTGLFNHRTGQEKLAEQLRVAERYQRNLAVVMIDVDHFKSINDTWGHPAGDTVLRAVAKLIKSDCRDVDIPVRYGGEEFLLILPEVNQEGAVVVAERIRRKLAKEIIVHDGTEIAVTSSLGVASYPEDAEAQQALLEICDRALYMSKRLGRNQVHTAGDLHFGEPRTTPESTSPVAPVAVETATAESVASQPASESAASQSSAPASVVEEPAKESEQSEGLMPEVVDMVKSLATALYSKSEYNKTHHLESARFAELLAKVMNLPQQQVEQVRVASLLHDVGVLSIPDEVINKKGMVSNEEMDLIAQHPVLGADLLRPIRALKEICDIVENHHECWDGSGYPRGLKGEDIPLAARIVSIVDGYHAMISDRPYRPAMTVEQARKALKNGAGTQWDPFMVDIFLAMLDSMEKEK